VPTFLCDWKTGDDDWWRSCKLVDSGTNQFSCLSVCDDGSYPCDLSARWAESDCVWEPTPTLRPTFAPIPAPTPLPTVSPMPSPVPSPAPTPFCAWRSPQAGAEWAIGSEQTVEWDYFVVATSVNLELVQGGVALQYIKVSYPVSAGKSVPWKVPDLAPGDYAIRLASSADATVYCDSPDVLIGDDDEDVSATAHLWYVPLVAAGVGMILQAVAYSRHQKEHEGKARISELQFALIELSLVDVTTDLLFVVEVWWHPIFGPTALAFLLLSFVANALLVIKVLKSSLDTGKTSKGPGLYAIIILLSVTSPDLLALLPWEGGDFDANGFPDGVNALVGNAKMLEDVPQFAIQVAYSATQSDRVNVLTWMSLGASTLCMLWRGLVACLSKQRARRREARVAERLAPPALVERDADDEREDHEREQRGVRVVGQVVLVLQEVERDVRDADVRAEQRGVREEQRAARG
jgi:hypothetical protein